MHRPLIYTGEVPLDTDFLRLARSTMIGLGMALQAVMGTSTVIDGLACNPTAPASMQVSIGSGSIMSVAPVDATAYGSLAADTTDQIVKQGIQLGAQLLTLNAPATSGYSQNYLICAAFAENDTTPVVLPYYNSASPSTPLLGPGGSGTAQNTIREGDISLQLVAGVAGPTGSQATPAAPPGATPLYVITVQNGQTTITSPNIATVAGAPFIKYKLPQLSPVTGALLASNNLNDLSNIATALANLGFKLTSGSNQWSLALGSVCTIKFGMVPSVPAEGSVAVTFTNPFASSAFVAFSTTNRTSIDTAGNYASYAGNLSTTGLTVYNDVGANVASPAAVPISWLAIGT